MDLPSTHTSYGLRQTTTVFYYSVEIEWTVAKLLILNVVRPTQLSKHDIHEL